MVVSLHLQVEDLALQILVFLDQVVVEQLLQTQRRQSVDSTDWSPNKVFLSQ